MNHTLRFDTCQVSEIKNPTQGTGSTCCKYGLISSSKISVVIPQVRSSREGGPRAIVGNFVLNGSLNCRGKMHIHIRQGYQGASRLRVHSKFVDTLSANVLCVLSHTWLASAVRGSQTQWPLGSWLHGIERPGSSHCLLPSDHHFTRSVIHSLWISWWNCSVNRNLLSNLYCWRVFFI